jgi:hypothetical protein
MHGFKLAVIYELSDQLHSFFRPGVTTHRRPNLVSL